MEMDLALGNPTEVESWDNEMWLGDAGASCHTTNTLDGMKNLTKINTGIVFGNGQRLKVTYIGEKAGSVIQKDGTRVPILMKNVKFVPDLYCNLFSISAVLREGYYLEGTLKMMKISTPGKKQG